MDKTYRLVEWPESQDFVGNPDCYLMQAMENQQYKDSAYFVPENLILELKTNSKSVADIKQMYHSQYQFMEQLLRESIRKYISRMLMDTSEDNPMNCNITLEYEEAFGLSTLQIPRITSMWQHPTEGLMYFVYDEDENSALEFDHMLLEDLVIICDYLDNN